MSSYTGGVRQLSCMTSRWWFLTSRRHVDVIFPPNVSTPMYWRGAEVRCEMKILSLMMPNSYPRDGIFNPHLTTIKDSYILGHGHHLLLMVQLATEEKGLHACELFKVKGVPHLCMIQRSIGEYRELLLRDKYQATEADPEEFNGVQLKPLWGGGEEGGCQLNHFWVHIVSLSLVIFIKSGVNWSNWIPFANLNPPI